MTQDISSLEARLNHFDLSTRKQALQALLEHRMPIFTLSQSFDATQGRSPNSDIANMHCHTFFSFNGYGHSPTSLAWLAKRYQINLMGIVDFDVLDGVDEFLTACDEVVELAQELDLPLNVGTEMNSYGQKLVDEFDTPELAPVFDAFIDGAYFIYGHTVAQRHLGKGYQSDWAKSHFPTRSERNAFYSKLGRQVESGPAGIAILEELVGAISDG